VSTRLYSNAELGLRFEIDDSFTDGPPLVPSPELPGNVTAAYLTAPAGDGGRATLSISRVEVGYDTSPQELAEQLVIHNRYAAHTAQQQGWTIHSPWKATTLGGYPAMRCDYVVPDLPASGPATGASAATGPVGEESTGEAATGAIGGDSVPGHVQAWVAYVGGQTLQLMLGVDPPGDLDANRRLMEQAMRSLELFEPVG
jgi:hypothetical protein